MRSRFDEHFSTTEFSRLFVGYSTLQNRHLRKVLLCRLNTFGNGSSNFTSLTKAPTDNTFFVTYYNNSREAKSSTTFGYLSHTIDSNQSVFQFYIV